MLIGQKWGCQGARFCGELFRPHGCKDEGAQGESMRASFRPVKERSSVGRAPHQRERCRQKPQGSIQARSPKPQTQKIDSPPDSSVLSIGTGSKHGNRNALYPKA